MGIIFNNENPNQSNQKNNTNYAEGTNGTLKVNDSTIELIRKGINAKLLGLRGDKEILISSINLLCI